MAKKTAKKIGPCLTGQVIDAMSDAERAAELDAEAFELRKTRQQLLRKIGPPKVGTGSQAISLTVEKELLGRATEFARRHGMKRAELFARGPQVGDGRSALSSGNQREEASCSLFAAGRVACDRAGCVLGVDFRALDGRCDRIDRRIHRRFGHHRGCGCPVMGGSGAGTTLCSIALPGAAG